MTIDEINTIRLALDTPENNRHYIKHTTDAKIILNKQQEAINYTSCCTQLPDGMMQIDNAYVEDSDEVDGYYVDGRYTKVLVLEEDFEKNKCIKN
jgi:hypothetical protein